MDIPTKDLTKEGTEINPRRGEVYRLEIIDAQGYEQKGDDEDMRLAVVISNNQQNAKKNVIVIVPLSSKVKKIYPFQVKTFFQGKAKCEQVQTITIERFKKKLGVLSEKEMNEIEEKLVFVLNLERLIKRKVQMIVQKYLKLSRL